MPSHLPKVSVIIPAYNAGAYLRATLQSVMDQTYQEFEVLVVDDGSTDDTAAVAQSFAPKVGYVYQANAGPSVARNIGILSSAGEILAFLDADDAWLPELLETHVNALVARPDVDGSFVWARFIDQHGGQLPDTLGGRAEEVTLRRTLLGGTPVQFSTLAVRKAVFDRIGSFDPELRQSEDWDVMLRMLIDGVRLTCVPRVLVLRRVHPDSLTADPGDALRWARLARQKAFTILPIPPEYRALAPIATFRILHRAAMGYWRRRAHEAAVERLLEALETWPSAARQPQTYAGLISRLLPSGHRSPREILEHLDRLAVEADQLIRAVLGHPQISPALQRQRRAAWSAFHAALAFMYIKKRRWLAASAHAVHAVVFSPVTPIRGAASFASRAAALITRH